MTAADVHRDWLVAARERAGLSQESLAHLIGVRAKSVSRWERGTSTPRVEIRPPLAEALGLTIDELARRLGLATAPEQASLNDSDANGFAAIAEWLSMFVRAQQSAYAIWSLVVTALPALCQTAGYARAVELSGHRQFPLEEIEELVRNRMARASVLGQTRYTALIAAPLIEATKGDPEIMADQTRHLLDLADRPNITLLVIDVEHLSATPGEFTLLATAGPEADMATEIGLRGPSYAEGRGATAEYVRLFDHLTSLARDQEASRRAIARAADRFAAMATTMKGT